MRVVSGRLFVAATPGPTAVELRGDARRPTVLKRRATARAYARHDRADVDLAFVGGGVWVSSFGEERIVVAPW